MERTPDAVAAAFGEQALTYRELDRRANRLGHLLAAGGRGARRAWWRCWPSAAWTCWCAMLGVFKAGGAYLPLDPAHPPQRLAQVLEQSGVPLVLVSRGAGARAAARAGGHARRRPSPRARAGGGARGGGAAAAAPAAGRSRATSPTSSSPPAPPACPRA